MARTTIERARAVKATVRERLRGLKGMTGVGLSKIEGEYVVKVNVSSPIPEHLAPPSEIDGVAIVVDVTGPIARQSDQ